MIKYFIDGKEMYMIGNHSYTKAEVDKMEADRQAKDEKAGYRDRMAGYYDKWYRYNRSDDGAAYDRGVHRAALQKKCPGDCTIIEVVEARV